MQAETLRSAELKVVTIWDLWDGAALCPAGNLTSVPETHGERRKDSQTLYSDLHTCVY